MRDGERFAVTATVERFGSKSGYKGPVETILLTCVKDADGKPLTDHIWLARGKQWMAINPGDRVRFTARVDSYVRGYQGRRYDVPVSQEIDYKLTRPTKVSVIRQSATAH
ncbi:hypothetical protein [Pseudotabrizicola alkalilacus]|uniref:Single-stranded DNA-binding protein n=1 Tax=Pseudotabrizicola alkalilacus TaxID=2305252 RepID=A0A411Z1J7_9RHOB|nr:hypothetical protein [Pseudotabrizicola alkalilacus]RGP36935.1 hypothetical protein D1012_12350 [Pseudotabrizicola alkalilacus]